MFSWKFIEQDFYLGRGSPCFVNSRKPFSAKPARNIILGLFVVGVAEQSRGFINLDEFA
jgi:hypothetical protein